MPSEPDHPITTPKGASALAILLGVVSVFAPFLFDLQSAYLFGALAIFVMAWVYWAEVRVGLASGSWNPHLNVPLGSIVAIILMGVVSARNAARAPKPTPVAMQSINTDDIARKVARMIQNPSSQQISNAIPHTATVPLRPITPPLIHQPRITGPDIAADSTPPKAVNGGDDFVRRLGAQMATDRAKLEAWNTCMNAEIPVNTELFRFRVQAANYQNAWAYNRDGDLLRREYDAWNVAVKTFLGAHRDVLGNIDGYDAVPELDMDSILSFLPNIGTPNAWTNFDNKRKVLDTLEQQFANSMCKAEDDALKTK